jgi:hypothetical protein
MLFFFNFWHSKIHVSSVGVISSLSPPRWRLSSGRRRHTANPYHASFALSQDELDASVLSSDNALSHRLPSQVEIESLNLYHCIMPSYPNCLTPILHCYKMIISILTTLPITQPRLHFVSSLATTPHHRSSICRCHSLSLLSQVHHPSGDELADHLSPPEQLIDMSTHVKRYFEITQHHTGL